MKWCTLFIGICMQRNIYIYIYISCSEHVVSTEAKVKYEKYLHLNELSQRSPYDRHMVEVTYPFHISIRF